ncbi:hypothetical protein [Aquimarina megaterium]|uniref:hypothetical protein n=1 Tax=Aquimarina megaterium TaxID=1443666 RepID=UPI001111D5FA|nr:hypothetical protein [Aquimarina megaterium]
MIRYFFAGLLFVLFVHSGKAKDTGCWYQKFVTCLNKQAEPGTPLFDYQYTVKYNKKSWLAAEVQIRAILDDGIKHAEDEFINSDDLKLVLHYIKDNPEKTSEQLIIGIKDKGGWEQWKQSANFSDVTIKLGINNTPIVVDASIKNGITYFYNYEGMRNKIAHFELKEGILSFTILLKKKAYDLSDQRIGKSVFKHAFEELGGGNKINKVNNLWPNMLRSDNFNTFKNKISEGLSAEQAALLTATGKWVKKDYPFVTFINPDAVEKIKKGESLKDLDVEVDFVKTPQESVVPEYIADLTSDLEKNPNYFVDNEALESWKVLHDLKIPRTSENLEFLQNYRKENPAKAKGRDLMMKDIEEAGGYVAWKKKVTAVADGDHKNIIKLGKNNTPIIIDDSAKNMIAFSIGFDNEIHEIASFELRNGRLIQFVNIEDKFQLKNQGIGKGMFHYAFDRLGGTNTIDRIPDKFINRQLSDNFDRFQKGLSDNLTPEQAALATYTGKWVKDKYPFVKIDPSIVDKIKNSSSTDLIVVKPEFVKTAVESVRPEYLESLRKDIENFPGYFVDNEVLEGWKVLHDLKIECTKDNLDFLQNYSQQNPDKRWNTIKTNIHESGGYDLWKQSVQGNSDVNNTWEFIKELGEDWSTADKEMLKSDLKESLTLENAINEDLDVLKIWKAAYETNLPKKIRLNTKGELGVIDIYTAEQSSGNVLSVARKIKKEGWQQWLIYDAGYTLKKIGKRNIEVYSKLDGDILFYYVNGNFFTKHETTFSVDKQVFSGNLFVPKHPQKREIELEIFKDAFGELVKNTPITKIEMNWDKSASEIVYRDCFATFKKNLVIMNPNEAAQKTSIGKWAIEQGFEERVPLKDAKAIQQGVKKNITIQFAKTIEGSIDYEFDTYVKRQLEDFRDFSKNSEIDICIKRVEKVARRNDIKQLARIFGLDKTVRGEKIWNSKKYYIPAYSNILKFEDKNLPDLILLNEETRIPYEVYVKDGKLYNDKLGSLSDFKESEESILIFVMDSKGNIYVGVSKNNVFHHSSFIPDDDKKLSTAGQFHYKQGKLIIDNQSGHYGPDLESLKSIVEELTLRGVSIWDIEIDNF